MKACRRRFSRGQLVVQRRVLEDEANARPDLIRPAANVEAGDPGLAVGRPDQGAERADGGRFPCPVGAQEAEPLAPSHLQVDAPDCLQLAEVPPQPACRDRRLDHASIMGSSPPPPYRRRSGTDGPDAVTLGTRRPASSCGQPFRDVCRPTSIPHRRCCRWRDDADRDRGPGLAVSTPVGRRWVGKGLPVAPPDLVSGSGSVAWWYLGRGRR